MAVFASNIPLVGYRLKTCASLKFVLCLTLLIEYTLCQSDQYLYDKRLTPIGVSGQREQREEANRCYDARNRPQRCVPEFINAAYLVPVEATNTCGTVAPIEYCVQTGVTGESKKTCEVCDASKPQLAHPPTYITDFNDNNERTWWQSDTMFEGIQFPNQVNLTLHLGIHYLFFIKYIV